MSHPGRWAGADVQANPAVACETHKGQWVVSFTACGMMALRTCQIMMMWYRLGCACFMGFPLLTVIAHLCWDCLGHVGKESAWEEPHSFCLLSWGTSGTQNKKCRFCWNLESLLWLGMASLALHFREGKPESPSSQESGVGKAGIATHVFALFLQFSVDSAR